MDTSPRKYWSTRPEKNTVFRVLFFKKVLFCQEEKSDISTNSSGDLPAQAVIDEDFCSLSDAWKRIVFCVKSSLQLQPSYCTVSSEIRGKIKSVVAERSVMALTDVVFPRPHIWELPSRALETNQVSSLVEFRV